MALGRHGECWIVSPGGHREDGGKTLTAAANTTAGNNSATYETTASAMPAPKSNCRRWFLCGLASVLVFVAVSAVGLVVSYRIWNGRRQAQQRAAVEKIVALGGSAHPSFSKLSMITILLETGNAPNVVWLNEKGLTDDDLVLFESAPTTMGINLFNNQITDQGLIHLKDLQHLETLDLRRNRGITDAGLVHLESLQNLKHLYLMRTAVTPAGAQKLQAKLPNTEIGY